MKKLETIEVLGKTIKVVYKELEEGDWGECCIDKKTIYLHKKCLKDPENHWLTLMHEVTHMIFQLSGLSFMENNEEESYVRCVENLVIPWILENQHLRD